MKKKKSDWRNENENCDAVHGQTTHTHTRTNNRPHTHTLKKTHTHTCGVDKLHGKCCVIELATSRGSYFNSAAISIAATRWIPYRIEISKGE